MPWGEFLLRGGGSAFDGVHASGGFSERGDYPDAGENRCAGEGKYRFICRASGNDGDFFKCGDAKGTGERTDGWRIPCGYSGGDCV